MSDQQQENEITTTQAAPAAPVASDQVAAPAQTSAPETPKAATAEKAVPATGEEAAPAKPKRTRRAAKPAADGEEVTKPKRRTARTTRAKRTVAADSSAPISDEVAQARALAQISEAQVVRARRRAAEREAAAYDEQAVLENKQKKMQKEGMTLHHSCPGMQLKTFEHKAASEAVVPAAQESQLSQWPVQIKLVPVNAPYFSGAKLLIAADCTAYAYAAFHEKFIKGHITLVGCPKLDSVDYSEKLTEIIAKNDIKSVTVVRMEVPCCGGLENAAKTALQNSGKFIPWQVVTISTDGRILDTI